MTRSTTTPPAPPKRTKPWEMFPATPGGATPPRRSPMTAPLHAPSPQPPSPAPENDGGDGIEKGSTLSAPARGD